MSDDEHENLGLHASFAANEVVNEWWQEVDEALDEGKFPPISPVLRYGEIRLLKCRLRHVRRIGEFAKKYLEKLAVADACTGGRPWVVYFVRWVTSQTSGDFWSLFVHKETQAVLDYYKEIETGTSVNESRDRKVLGLDDRLSMPGVAPWAEIDDFPG